MTDSILALADLATPMAVRVAATLGLVEQAGPGASPAQLAVATGTSADAMECLLDHLVTVGVFEISDGVYRATALGEQMRGDAPEGVKPLLDINAAGGRAELAFVELLHTLRTGEPAYPRHYGRDFWADLDERAELRRSFDAQMNWRFQAEAGQIATGFDWGRFTEILDVGGGDGVLLDAILRAHPEVRGRVLDLSPTAEAAAERLAPFGERAGAVVGSFFDPLPVGADLFLLSDILHDWDDDHARQILRQCRAAAGPDGTVVVTEPVRGYGATTGIDLFMLMCFGGRERTVDRLAALAADVGLVLRGSRPVSDGRILLEFGVGPDEQ